MITAPSMRRSMESFIRALYQYARKLGVCHSLEESRMARTPIFLLGSMPVRCQCGGNGAMWTLPGGNRSSSEPWPNAGIENLSTGVV